MIKRFTRWLLSAEVKRMEQAERYHERMAADLAAQHRLLVQQSAKGKDLVEALGYMMDMFNGGKGDELMSELVRDLNVSAFYTEPSVTVSPATFDTESRYVRVEIPATVINYGYMEDDEGDPDVAKAYISPLVTAARFIHFLKVVESE